MPDFQETSRLMLQGAQGSMGAGQGANYAGILQIVGQVVGVNTSHNTSPKGLIGDAEGIMKPGTKMVQSSSDGKGQPSGNRFLSGISENLANIRNSMQGHIQAPTSVSMADSVSPMSSHGGSSAGSTIKLG